MAFVRRVLIPALALLLTMPLGAPAQSAGRPARIGYLGGTPSPAVDAFRQGLRDLGYVEGQNILLEYRWHEGHVDRAPALAAELAALKPDVIVAASLPVIRAVQRATTTIPIVMAASFDPVAAGLVASLARPGGNTTGLSLASTDVTAKRLEVLREIVPDVARVAVLLGPPAPADSLALAELEAAARATRVRLQTVRAHSPAELETAFAAMVRERASAVLLSEHPIFGPSRARVADLAKKHRLPMVASFREQVQAGALASYGADLTDLYRRAAGYVDRILRGARPADLPIEQPTRFTLVVNLATAKALGISIPGSVLARADDVIR